MCYLSYIYDALKEVIGGKNKDYSPNEIKSLFICRDFIFVARHVKPFRVKRLDPQLFYEDLKFNGSKGALHNLLGQRQLSCLEELYYDQAFLNYPGAFDVNAYLGKLMTEKSRLRYYGVCDKVTVEELSAKYAQNSYNYAYVEDRNKVGVVNATSTDNAGWYHNYNLRPKMYSADSKNGKLYVWFVKAEKAIDEAKTAELQAMEVKGLVDGVYILYSQDLLKVRYLYMLIGLRRYCLKSSDAVCKSVGKCITGKLTGMMVKGFSPDALKIALRHKHMNVDKGLLTAYKNLRVFDPKVKENGVIRLKDIVPMAQSGEGFLKLNTLLMNICKDFYESQVSNKLIFLICFDKYKEEIPQQELSELVGINTSGNDCIGYLKLLLGLCGWDYDSFSEYMTSSVAEEQ